MDCDLLLSNGCFITLGVSQPAVNALAIKDGRIIWMGDEWKGFSKSQIDLKGGQKITPPVLFCVIPQIPAAPIF